MSKRDISHRKGKNNRPFAFLLSTGHIVHRPYVILSIFSTNVPGWRGISLPTLSTYIIAIRGTEQQLQTLDRLY